MAHDQTLLQIRERSFLNLLDLGLIVLRSHPLALGLAAIAGVLPFAILNTWLHSDPEMPLSLYGMLLLLEAPWATAPLTIVLGAMMFGETPGVWRVVKGFVAALPKMILFQLVVRVILCFPILIWVIPVQLAYLNEVILLERGPWRRVISRSELLCRKRGWEFFVQWLIYMLFATVFIGCFYRGSGALISALFTAELTWAAPDWSDLDSFRCQLAIWTSIVFFGLFRFLAYIDQRIRLEGWEVKLRLEFVARSLGEADA